MTDKAALCCRIRCCGTHTRAVLIEFSGNIQVVRGFSGEGGRVNFPASTGWDNALSNILGAAYEAIGKAGVKPSDVIVVGISASYTGWGKYISKYTDALRKIFKNAKIQVYHDIHASLLSCFPRGEGIVLIMGTGSSCLGIINDKKALVGGWGHLLDDKAGAYRAGRDGIAAALEYFDVVEKRLFFSIILGNILVSNTICYDIVD